MKRVMTYADPNQGLCNPLDLYSMVRHKKEAVQSKAGSIELTQDLLGKRTLDFSSWLPFAAKVLNISRDPLDYILVPVVIIPSDLPNRNGVGFPLKELIGWDPEQGMQAYKTFNGKPVYVEHNNSNFVEARGVIIDTFLRRMEGYGGGRIWKVVCLLAIDRTKDPTRVSKVLSGELNSYSMGAWVSGYYCSYCGADMGKCGHLNPRNATDFYELKNKLVYRLAKDPRGFEVSIVADPAYRTAISDKIIVYGDDTAVKPAFGT